MDLKMDKSAAEHLYRTYGRLVKYVAFSVLENDEKSEDVMMESFARLFEALEKRSIPNPKAYLCRIAVRLALKEKKSLPEELNEDLVCSDSVALANLEEDLCKAINGLSVLERKTVTLRAVCDMSYFEISRALGGTALSVQSRYRRAIRKLRAKLGEGYAED